MWVWLVRKSVFEGLSDRRKESAENGLIGRIAEFCRFILDTERWEWPYWGSGKAIGADLLRSLENLLAELTFKTTLQDRN